MLSFSAFSFLLGPMFDPATKKDVFDEIEDETLPPFVSISFLISSLEKF